MYTVLDEPRLIQEYNSELYRLVNFYSNVKRTANFVRYYNLAMKESPRKDITLETYDDYIKTQNVWDVYELTPMQIVSAIQNSPENAIDLKGHTIMSATTMQLYTIDNPRIGDIVTFYKPAESEEVLRVVNIRMQLNSNYSTVPLKFYEVDLETAPIKFDNLSQLLKNKHYVYDLAIERNVEYSIYKEYIQQMKSLETVLEEVNQYYLPQHDFYGIGGEVVCEMNELMYFVKGKFNNKYYRLFEKVRSPYGYWDHYEFKHESIGDLVKSAAGRKFNLIDYSKNTERQYILPKSCPCSKKQSELDKFLYLYMSLLTAADSADKYINQAADYHDKKKKTKLKVYQEGCNATEPEDSNYNVGC